MKNCGGVAKKEKGKGGTCGSALKEPWDKVESNGSDSKIFNRILEPEMPDDWRSSQYL